MAAPGRVWALIALASPAFGFLFLLPWGVPLYRANSATGSTHSGSGR